MKRLSAILLTAVLLALAGCGSAKTTSAAPAAARASAPAAAPATLPFGTTSTLTTAGGAVKVSLTAPKAVTFHTAEYDPTCKVHPAGCDKPGKVLMHALVTTVTWAGVAGSVDVAQAFEYEYQEPGGTLDSDTLPLETFEAFDPITNHDTVLAAGQKTHGQVAFETSAPGGKIIVVDDTTSKPAATFAS